MNVEVWTVGAKSPKPVPLTAGDVCGHLLSDWMPSLPAFVGSSFVGWPPFLLKPVRYKRRTYLGLEKHAGQAERQWKGFLSWMLGIAGTRHFLRADGYRWIAPVSAFLDNAVKPVSLHGWPAALPRSVVSTRRRPGSSSRLLPDYLALRPTTQAAVFDWAVVESKGTHACLTNRSTCPSRWYEQARNIQVSLGTRQLRIPRHIVVATRVNPNGTRDSSRRLQIRAWNSVDAAVEQTALPPVGVVDLVSGHLFGLFRAVRLLDNARAVAYGVQVRAGRQGTDRLQFAQRRERAAAAAEAELYERTGTDEIGGGAIVLGVRTLPIETDFADLQVRIAPALFQLARALSLADTVEEAAAAIRNTDEQLDKVETLLAGRGLAEPDEGSLSAGVSVRIRRRFEDQ